MAALMLIAIKDLPYGYYTFLRISTFLSSIALACVYSKKYSSLFISFIIVGILFNPIIPIHLTKDIWRYINILVGIFFMINVYFLRIPATHTQKFKS